MAVRALIADSSGRNREIIRYHLDCMGCQVVAETDDAEQTANLFRTVRPQVVMIDANLKVFRNLDAHGLVQMIREDLPETAIIAIGPAGDPEAMRQFADEGAVDCLFEPLASEGFARVCRKLEARFPELRRVEPPPIRSSRPPRSNLH